MIMLLAFAVIVPLVSVPTVSAKTVQYKVIQSIWIWPEPGFDPLGLHPGEHIYWLEDLYTIDGRHVGILYDYGTDKTYLVGTTEHFFEEWVLRFDDGGWIAGTVEGVWSLVTFKARCTGLVTDASPDRVSYIGSKFSSQGTTSNPDDSFVGEDWISPITGTSTMRFSGK